MRQISRVAFVLFVLYVFQPALYAQAPIGISELVGIWQADDSTDGAGWLDCYRFFPDGRFAFHFNQYNGSKRILSFSGTYVLHGDTLITHVTERTELRNGFIERGSPAFENEWILEGAEKVTVSQEPHGEDRALIRGCKSNKRTKKLCMEVSDRKYFKMRSNPSKYE